MSYSTDSIDMAKLPLEIRAKLAELDLEISEGQCFHCISASNFFNKIRKLVLGSLMVVSQKSRLYKFCVRSVMSYGSEFRQ